MIYRRMDYIRFDINNPYCLHVMLSNRAYCSIINETFEHGTDETGGLLMGYIIGRKWYVVDVIDPGTNNTIHETGLFQWDQNYVNLMAARMRKLYRNQPTILGFWHRHPGSMDFFSQQDVESTQKNLQEARKGLISMLVNIDPDLRMTFYHCHGPHFMPVRYDVGDEYFPVELLEYATPQQISQRHAMHRRSGAVRISYRRIIQPPTAPGTDPRRSFVADNDEVEETVAVAETPVQENEQQHREEPPKQEEIPVEAPVSDETQETVYEEITYILEVPAEQKPKEVTEDVICVPQTAPEEENESPVPETESAPEPEKPENDTAESEPEEEEEAGDEADEDEEEDDSEEEEDSEEDSEEEEEDFPPAQPEAEAPPAEMETEEAPAEAEAVPVDTVAPEEETPAAEPEAEAAPEDATASEEKAEEDTESAAAEPEEKGKKSKGMWANLISYRKK